MEAACNVKKAPPHGARRRLPRRCVLRLAAAAQAFLTKLLAKFRFVVALVEEEGERVFYDGAFADALEERKTFQAVGKIYIESVRYLRNVALRAEGGSGQRRAFREFRR
jgi:hypothetical protein